MQIEIDEFIIYAYKDPIHYRGDTLVYIADSFSVKPNAVVEDLLKKLPGMEVDKDGKIKVQGRKVDKVLVDGDEFFGKDPTLATKNLNAEDIQTVEIYEKNDENAYGSDEKIQVLDLKLKDDAKKGYFGKTSLASDLGVEKSNDLFYEGEALYNRFKNKQKISGFILGTNTPKDNFSYEDANKFELNNEINNDFNFIDNTPNGIPRTFKTGVYYRDKLGKNEQIQLGGNYTYSNTEMDAYTNSRAQVFLADTNYTTNDSIERYTRKLSHSINLSLNTPLDSLTQLKIEPSISINQNTSIHNDRSTYINENEQSFLNTQIKQKQPRDDINLNTWMRITRKLNKEKRSAEINYRLAYDEITSKGNLFTQNTFPYNSIQNDTVDQTKYNAHIRSQNTITGVYTEPLGKRWKTSLTYQYDNSELVQDRITNDYNIVNNTYSTYRPDLSNNYKTIRNEHTVGAKAEFDTTKHNISLRMDLKSIDIENIDRITDLRINQNITNLLPSIQYRYRISMNHRYSLRYSTYSSIPSINDIQPVADNSNPNRIKEGNPNLQPSYNHNINFWHNAWQPLTGGYTWLGGSVTFTNNAFTDSTVYNSFGQRTSKRINVNGNNSVNLYGGMGIPLKGLVIQLRPRGSFYSGNYNNFINGERNKTRNLSFTIGSDFVINLDSFQLELSGYYRYYKPKNSLSSVSNLPSNEKEYTTDITWQLPYGFSIATNFTYLITSKRSAGYNINSFVWNAQLNKSFLPTDNLIVSLIANDLLDQNINTNRITEANMIIDNQTRLITRYFLLKVTLKFNNNKTREDDPKNLFN